MKKKVNAVEMSFSRQDAHNLDDLWERWCLKREALAIDGIDDFIRPPKPEHNTTDGEKSLNLLYSAKKQASYIYRAITDMKINRNPNTPEWRYNERKEALELEYLYWGSVIATIAPLAYGFRDEKKKKEMQELNHLPENVRAKIAIDNKVMGLETKLDKAKSHNRRLEAYQSYLHDILKSNSIKHENFDNWTANNGFRDGGNCHPSTIVKKDYEVEAPKEEKSE